LRSRGSYRNYLLSLLLVILAFNYVDRLALGLMLQEIKGDLHLTDTQLGFLTGIAFALFYSIMGIPIARWADRGNRVLIISLTLAVWSVMVSLCGRASDFLQLLLARVGVAAGEAGCIPPAHSLIADYFTRSERPRAVARYMLGGPLACVIGFFLAGWLNELYGWRITFMLLGVPGMVLSALTWLTVREPRRAGLSRDAIAGVTQQTRGLSNEDRSATQPGLFEVLNTLWWNPTFRHLLFSYSVYLLFGYGISTWLPAFLIRSFGLQTGVIGIALALIWGAGGIVGTWCGGELASRYAAHQERLQLRAMALAHCVFGIFSIGTYLAPNLYLSLGLMTLSAVGTNATNGPLFATIQTLVPQNMRAISIALIYLVANLIGMGIGPLVVGVLSDALRAWAGEDSLRYALLAVSPGFFWVAWHVWRASSTVTQDLQKLQTAHRLDSLTDVSFTC